MSEPIVVGADGSMAARIAVEWAADEAARRNRPLHIVHAAERWMYDIHRFPPPGMADSLTEAAHNMLAEAAAEAAERQPGVAVTTELVNESPAVALRTRSSDAFEVVVGHRGLGGFASMLLGSTGLQVAGHAAGPVVIVRGENRKTSGEVLVGIDLSEHSAEALQYALDAAAVRDAEVRVLHAWQLSGTLVSSGYAIDVDEVVRSTERNLADALGPWRERFPKIKITEESVRDHPVSALVEGSIRADLVVVGSHGMGGRNPLRLGSVSHGVIHHAHCPVAVVRRIRVTSD